LRVLSAFLGFEEVGGIDEEEARTKTKKPLEARAAGTGNSES
jgi:hypothetical protein